MVIETDIALYLELENEDRRKKPEVLFDERLILEFDDEPIFLHYKNGSKDEMRFVYLKWTDGVNSRPAHYLPPDDIDKVKQIILSQGYNSVVVIGSSAVAFKYIRRVDSNEIQNR